VNAPVAGSPDGAPEASDGAHEPSEGAHEAKPAGLWSRYRAQYEKLPPGAQMIGLQLWLPLVFVIAFCFCYIAAFHAPAPHQVSVAVIGQGTHAQAAADALQKGAGDSLRVRLEPDVAAARADVRDGDLAAAYLPDAKKPTLILASAASYQLSAVAKATFQATASATGGTLQVDDLAALPAHDAYGTTLFYVTLVWTIAGYMVGMFVGMMGGALKHRMRIGILAAAGVVLPLISTLIIVYALGAVSGNFWELWGIGVATAFTIGLVVNGLGYFLGRFVTAAALILFVFANVPGSGGAYPPEFLPQPFRALHNVVSGTGTLDMLRSVVYDVGPGAGRGAIILAVYAAVGVLLSVVGKRFFVWRMGRRAARGARPTMMIAAQLAAMAAASSASPATGAHAAPEDEGAVSVEELRARQEDDEAAARRSAYAAQEMDGDAVAAVTGAEA